MTAQDLKSAKIADPIAHDEEYSIPLCIDDIISICREYNRLGHQIQNQVQNILDIGVEQSIKTNYVKRESLPHIKNFLKAISENPYFGDATDQAEECMFLIDEYQSKHKTSISLSN